MNHINFEQIIRKHFQGVNREGLGFLESNIQAAVAALKQATSHLHHVIFLTDQDLKPGLKVVDIAFEPGEVSIPQLSLVSHFRIPSRDMYQAELIIYNGKLGQRVFKCRPSTNDVVKINHLKYAKDIMEDTDHRKDTMSQVEARNIINAYHIEGATKEDIDQIAELLIALYKVENEVR